MRDNRRLMEWGKNALILLLTLSADTIHHKLLKKITALNDVPEEPTNPRVLGKNMCVPFGKLLRARRRMRDFHVLRYPHRIGQRHLRTAGVRPRHYPGIRRHTETCPLSRYGTCKRDDLHL